MVWGGKVYQINGGGLELMLGGLSKQTQAELTVWLRGRMVWERKMETLTLGAGCTGWLTTGTQEARVYRYQGKRLKYLRQMWLPGGEINNQTGTWQKPLA